MVRFIVSACLVGFNCKYSGGNNYMPELEEAFKKGLFLPLCPEQLGGLATPRPPAKIEKGEGLDVIKGNARVLTVKGKQKDVTRNFIKGAEETLFAAEKLKDNLVACILKEKSPSCGVNYIYKFEEDTLKRGRGVTAALLEEKGFKIISSDNIKEIEKLLKEFL